MAVNFKEIFTALKQQVETLAKGTLKNYSNEAIKDGKKFLDESKENLERWTKLLAEGKLTLSDFEWLVMSQKDLAKMEALKQAGLALVRVDAFRQSLLNLVIDTVFNKIIP